MLTTTTAAPIAPSGRLRQNSPTAASHRRRPVASGISAAASAGRPIAIIPPGKGTRAVATPVPSSPEPDSGVDPGVRQVDQEVDEDEDERHQHDERLRERVVAVADGF